jgi:hypothetical protein
VPLVGLIGVREASRFVAMLNPGSSSPKPRALGLIGLFGLGMLDSSEGVRVYAGGGAYRRFSDSCRE